MCFILISKNCFLSSINRELSFHSIVDNAINFPISNMRQFFHCFSSSNFMSFLRWSKLGNVHTFPSCYPIYYYIVVHTFVATKTKKILLICWRKKTTDAMLKEHFWLLREKQHENYVIFPLLLLSLFLLLGDGVLMMKHSMCMWTWICLLVKRLCSC